MLNTVSKIASKIIKLKISLKGEFYLLFFFFGCPLISLYSPENDYRENIDSMSTAKASKDINKQKNRTALK